MRPITTLPTITFALLSFASFGQTVERKVGLIDSVCYFIDNKGLVEGISEGPIIDKKGKTIGGFETRDLKDNTTLFRLKYEISTDRTYTTTYYYNKRKVIKATLTIGVWEKDHLKITHAAKYYFDDELITATGEIKEFLTGTQILEQGQKFQLDFYTNKK
jgi:hypothetical protein